MASIRHTPAILRHVGLAAFLKKVWAEIGSDNVFTWGAALAYAWLFAIFPFIVFLLSLVPLVPARFKPDVQKDVSEFLDKTLPPDAASVFTKQVSDILAKPSAGGFLSFGLILTIWAASGGMSMTMSALDRAYDVETVRSYFRQRSMAILLTVVVATILILVMALMPISTGVLYWLVKHGKIFGWAYHLVNLARYAIALVLLFLVLAIVYHWGPSFRNKFQAVTPGAVFTIAVWLLLGSAFKLYLTKYGGAASYDKTYGAVAGAAIMLLFFYIDALVLLIGAEINSEIDTAAQKLNLEPKSPEKGDSRDDCEKQVPAHQVL